jgi:long-chain acyl-CoA synthetase
LNALLKPVQQATDKNNLGRGGFMHPYLHARNTPDKPAVIFAGSGRQLSYAQLEARSNLAAHALRRLGLKRGDTLALLMDNHERYFELCFAAQRSGLFYCCISTKLAPGEVDYIVRDCGARALVVSSTLHAQALLLHPLLPDGLTCLSVGEAVAGYQAFEPLCAQESIERLGDESLGRDMLYSSGTTGRPKGIRTGLAEGKIDDVDVLMHLTKLLYNFGPEMRYLSPAPLYHAAPLRYCMSVLKFGGSVVVMEHFDPEAALGAIERYQITHSQWVPTMFVRMLKLPVETRTRYNLASLQVAVHAAAPCPIEVKEQMMAWWGPVIYEYYSATEGAGFTAISPQEWLAKKGSVGKALLGSIHIVDEEGNDLPAYETGRVCFSGGPPFAYHGEQASTSTHDAQGRASFGDVGYVDSDGYLFLTDRKAFMIISGGVNVYPQETENTLILHPKVADVAVIGVPDPDLGEAVKAVVQPVAWGEAGPELAAELMAFCRARLGAIKCPRSIDFDPELPRQPTGKLYKRLIRDRYWGKT